MVTQALRALSVSPDFWLAVEVGDGAQEGPRTLLASSNCLLAGGVLLVPRARAEAMGEVGRVLARELRRVSATGGWLQGELVAAAAQALAEVGVPFLVVSGKDRVDFFIPHEKLGRALAALRQARLERFSQPG